MKYKFFVGDKVTDGTEQLTILGIADWKSWDGETVYRVGADEWRKDGELTLIKRNWEGA